MVQKGIRERIWHAIHQYGKADNKYIKYYDENKEYSYPMYWYVNM